MQKRFGIWEAVTMGVCKNKSTPNLRVKRKGEMEAEKPATDNIFEKR